MMFKPVTLGKRTLSESQFFDFSSLAEASVSILFSDWKLDFGLFCAWIPTASLRFYRLIHSLF